MDISSIKNVGMVFGNKPFLLKKSELAESDQQNR